jgi:HSP20 family protein
MANIIRRNDRESRDVAPRGRGQYDPWNRSAQLDPFRILGELMRWDPFADIDRYGGIQAGGFVPAVEVRETADGYNFRVDLPGVKEDDVDISLTGNRLTISGQREEEKRNDSDRYHSYECSYGSFSRAFSLPEGADPDSVRAEMKNGVLTVSVPKRPEVQPRRIPLGQQSQQGQPGNGGKTPGQPRS